MFAFVMEVLKHDECNTAAQMNLMPSPPRGGDVNDVVEMIYRIIRKSY